MSNLILRPATPDDCAELALTMRQADRTEIALGGASSAYDALMRGVVNSATPQALVNAVGEVIGIGGVVQLAPDLGSPWLLASDGLVAVKWPFLRECRGRLMEVHAAFPRLYNTVWEGNHVHIRWLKWLGFTVGEASSHRPHFLPFWKNNHVLPISNCCHRNGADNVPNLRAR